MESPIRSSPRADGAGPPEGPGYAWNSWVPRPEQADRVTLHQGHDSRRPEVGRRAAEASDDLLALGDQLDDLHLHVREALEKRRDPSARAGGHLGVVELVD